MSKTDKKKGDLKKKIVHELIEYWINVCYLSIVFAAFTQYRRFVLAAYDITYTNYWVAVIEALILAKVIMIGDVVRLGRGLEQKPLIYPTLYKSFAFIVFVGVFKFIEHVIMVLWNGEEITRELFELSENGFHELLANSLVVFVAFIPFFAVKELGRMFGKDKIFALFFQRRATP
jgi:hypothetical protein